MNNSISNKEKGGFTLIELLVVIAIIAILAVVVVLTLNPAELLRQARDSNRVSDFATIKSAINLYEVNGGTNLASSSLGYGACYLSAVSSNATTTARCGVFATPQVASDSTSTAANYRNVNASGWIPINFASAAGGAPFGSLPVDPTNNTSYYYAYAATSTDGGLYELSTFIESKKYGLGGSNSVVTSGTIYQTGSVTTL